MESVLEHRIEAAGHRTRALEVAGERPRHRAPARLERLRGHLAPAAGPARLAAAGARSPSTCRASARRRACTTARCCRSWTPSPPTWSSAGRAASRSSSPAPRSAAASRCGWPRPRASVRLAGVVTVAPDGLEMPSWFDPIEEDPIVRKLLSIPVPVPGVLVRRAKSSAYRQLAFLPAELDAARGRRRVRPRRRDARGPRGAAGVRPRARAGALDRPVRPDRHPLPRAARVGRARPDAAAHRRPASRSTRCPTTQVELIEGAGHHPQLEATGRLLELLLPFGT